jgi:prevent-host-death family protein
MAIETTYTNLQQNLARVLDQVVEDQETVIVRRKKSGDVALIPASELAGLMETAHLCARLVTPNVSWVHSTGRNEGRAES